MPAFQINESDNAGTEGPFSKDNLRVYGKSYSTDYQVLL